MNSSSPSQSRSSAFVDIALVVGILLSVKSILLQYDIVWSFAGPISLLVAVAVATICLRWRGQDWTMIGLGRPAGLRALIVQTGIALIATVAIGAFAQSLAPLILGAPDASTQVIDARYQGRFAGVTGSLPDLLLWLSVAWIIGAFAEEMLFRAMLISRFERLLSGLRFPAVGGVLLQAVLFGQQHLYYQGAAGWLANGAIGLVSGLLYLKFGRTLWPLVIAHGLSNTIGLTLVYFGQAG